MLTHRASPLIERKEVLEREGKKGFMIDRYSEKEEGLFLFQNATMGICYTVCGSIYHIPRAFFTHIQKEKRKESLMARAPFCI